MKKFLTLLSAALISVVSFATVASAEDAYKPTVALDVTRVMAGRAIVTATVELDKDLDFVNEGDDSFYFVTGTGMTSWQVDMNLDSEIFSVEKSSIAGGYMGEFKNVKISNGKKVTVGTATIVLNDAYKAKTADELNALKFADVTNAIVGFTTWKEAFEPGELISELTYSCDGNGDFDIDLSATRIGTYVDEPVTPPAPEYDFGTAGNEFEGKASKYWTVNYEAGEFTGTDVIELSDGETTKSINVTTAEGFDIGGAVSFYVYVIGNDIANVYIVE